MASTAAPYGFRAVNLLGGLPFAGQTRQYLINPAGYNTNVFNGSIVCVNTSGYLEIVTTVGGAGGDAFPAGVVGVFVGCEYVNAQGQLIFSQYYPANTVAPAGTAIKAYVVDDDRAVFQVQADGSVGQTSLGQNVILAAAQSSSTGSTSTGNSNTAVSATAAATASYPFRIVGFVESTTSSVGDAKTDLLVKFNAGIHSYSNATGLA